LSDPAGSPAPTDDLKAALEQSLEQRTGGGGRIVGLVRRPSPFRTSFPIEELDLRTSDGAALSIVFKDLDRGSLSDVARKAKPEFLFDPAREIETYGSVLAGAGLGTPEYYGSVLDRGRDRYWLFVENVRGVALWQVGDFSIWQEAARWLANLHNRFGVTAEGELQQASLLRYDERLYRVWLERARGFAAERPPRDRLRAGLDWLAARYDAVVERLVSLPTTFIHGEFYPSNVLVREGASTGGICPLDWELAAVGPGLIDLAALTAGKLAEDQKTAIATAYWDASAPGGRLSATERQTALDYCRLHLAVQWLGWAPDWRPPRKQRQDWIGEALDVAERLGL
jgi:hypothetical protein